MYCGLYLGINICPTTFSQNNDHIFSKNHGFLLQRGCSYLLHLCYKKNIMFFFVFFCNLADAPTILVLQNVKVVKLFSYLKSNCINVSK